MKIIRIEKKNERNIVVFLDNNEQLFLSYEVLLKNGLKKNSEISESRFNLLIEENQKYFIKLKAFDYLSRRLHSAYELKNKLKLKGYRGDFITDILNELKENGYLDDQKFSMQFAEEKSFFKNWSRAKIKVELKKKGIDRDIINSVLAFNNEEDSEFSNAQCIAEKKLKSLKSRNIPIDEIEKKLFSFLSQRGFDYELIVKAVSSILGKE